MTGIQCSQFSFNLDLLRRPFQRVTQKPCSGIRRPVIPSSMLLSTCCEPGTSWPPQLSALTIWVMLSLAAGNSAHTTADSAQMSPPQRALHHHPAEEAVHPPASLSPSPVTLFTVAIMNRNLHMELIVQGAWLASAPLACTLCGSSDTASSPPCLVLRVTVQYLLED